MRSAEPTKSELHPLEEVPEAPDHKLLDVDKMAEILSVNKNWLYRRTMQGREGIPHYRVGRHVRFLASEVLEFLRHDPEAGKEYPGKVSYGR